MARSVLPEIDHQEHVEQRDREFESAEILDQVDRLERKPDRARRERDPRAPGPGFLEAVGFDETEGRIDGRDRGEHADPLRAQPVERAHEDLRHVMRGIQMQVRDHSVRDRLPVLVQSAEQAEPGEQNGEAFQRLENRDAFHRTDVLTIHSPAKHNSDSSKTPEFSRDLESSFTPGLRPSRRIVGEL